MNHVIVLRVDEEGKRRWVIINDKGQIVSAGVKALNKQLKELRAKHPELHKCTRIEGICSRSEAAMTMAHYQMGWGRRDGRD